MRNNNKKTTNQAGKDYGTTTDAMLPQSLPYVNDYAWPLPDSMSKDQCRSEQKQNMVSYFTIVRSKHICGSM